MSLFKSNLKNDKTRHRVTVSLFCLNPDDNMRRAGLSGRSLPDFKIPNDEMGRYCLHCNH